MKKTKVVGKAQLRIEALAQRILPMVGTNPDMAFAASIARRFPEGAYARQAQFGYENDVSAALRHLKKQKLLTSKSVPHPQGRPGRIMLYALTPKDAVKVSTITSEAGGDTTTA